MFLKKGRGGRRDLFHKSLNLFSKRNRYNGVFSFALQNIAMAKWYLERKKVKPELKDTSFPKDRIVAL